LLIYPKLQLNLIISISSYTTGRAVFGRCRIKAYVKENTVDISSLDAYPFLERYIEQFDGVIDFFFSMSELLAVSGKSSLDELEVYVVAQVEDPYFEDLSNGSFITTLYDPKIRLKFLGSQPRAFKPKMPYTTYISVAQQDGTPLPPERARNSYVRVLVELNGAASMGQLALPIGPNSIVSYTFTPDASITFLAVTAVFVENNIDDPNSVIKERGIRYKSLSNSYIYVTSSTTNPQVGDYMIFTVKVSHPVDNVFYHIVSASRIIFTDVLNMNNKQKTFDVGLTREMAPSAHIVVYFVRYDGELVADSYNFHVNASSVQNKVNMTINRRKDFTGDTIEILAYASPQSFVGFAALDESLIRLYNGGNIITELMLYDELYSFDTHANTSFHQTWNAELGFAADRIFYPSQSYAYDAMSTFSYTGLLLFTDLPVIDTLNQSYTTCNASYGLHPCLDGATCYNSRQRCDGVCQCPRDCSDETNCPERIQFYRPLHERFSPKIERIYQLSWLWKDSFTLPDGRVQFRAEVSKDIANYVVSAFAVSRLSGFGVLKIPGRIATTRQFYIQVEMPPECRLGEQLGIRVDAFNFQSQRIEGLIILHPSEDYRFVNVEKDGLVSSFAPKLSTGQHHVLLIIQPGKSRRIHIPIVPLRSGIIEVTIEALSGANRDRYTNQIQVRYEGVTNVYHTPYLLSLVNMPRMISEFEIVTNQTFLLPLQQIWTFIPGSPSAQVFINGDVCGPFFFLGYDNFMNTDNYLKKSFAAIEAGIFSFGTMLYNLMYMRQGHGGRNFPLENVLKILEWVNHEYLRIMICYDQRGFFTQYGVPGTESVWVTSWAITVIKDGVDPVWEQYSLYIDPELLNNTVIWLISQQNPINGSWAETGPVYDRKFVSNWTRDWDGSMVQLNLSLTAQVLIALKVNSDIRGYAAKIISNSINKARMYLEQHFTKITDAFERAIVTYALHITNSPIKDMAMQILNQTKFKNDYGIYWSNWEIPRMRIYWPSKNPRQNWKPESSHEGYAVATTAYALLTHILRADSYNKYEIMTWLQTQRNYLGGMSSTYDSLLAHRALVLYAISTGDTIQNYNININFTSSSSADLDMNYLSINDSNIIQLQEYDIQNVWGNLLVDGQGTGYALVQLRVMYNVEYPWLIRKPPYEAFNMTLQTRLYGRNFSHIDYHVCLNWLPQNVVNLYSNRSGHAQFELQIPTGYRIEERYLKTLIGELRNLGDAENAPGPQVNFLFDFLDLDPICFSFTLERYLPVANLSRYYEMKVFEYHEPGNANRSMYFLRDIFGLDICEVCGSYQCPYCPYYAFAVRSHQINPVVLLLSFIFFFIATFKYFVVS
jgi:hypothetical protein